MRSTGLLLLAALTAIFPTPAIAQSTSQAGAWQHARWEFDQHMDSLARRVGSTRARIERALSSPTGPDAPDRDQERQASGSEVQASLVEIWNGIAAIPRLDLVHWKPAAQPAVQASVDEMLKLLSSLATEVPSSGLDESFDPERGFVVPAQGDSGLDIPIGQGNFGLSAPSFGGFGGSASGLQLGLTVLSEIEGRLMAVGSLPELDVTPEIRQITIYDPDDRNFAPNVASGPELPGPVPAIKVDLDAILIGGGALNDIYDSGFGANIGLALPFGTFDSGFMPYVVGGCQVQSWGAQGVNVNGPAVNLRPDGDLIGVGGYVGGGIEWSRLWTEDVDLFLNLESTVGVGQLQQGLRNAAFNPALPTIGIDNNSPATSAAYVNGVFRAAIGIGGPDASLAATLAYQIQGTDLVTNRWNSTDSLLIGMQGSVTTDLLRMMLSPRRRLGREATPNQFLLNSRLWDR